MNNIITFIALMSVSVALPTVHAIAADQRTPVNKPPNLASPSTFSASPPATGGISAKPTGQLGGVVPGGKNAVPLTENGCVSMGGQINRDSKECNDKGLPSCKIIVGGMAQWLCIDNK